ncbi:MAG: porin family protein [Thiomicrorhabdus sp.]|nr:porin family protein [Thiomicrorhabdus sp.]
MKNLFKSMLGMSLAASLALFTSTASAGGFYIGGGVYKANIDADLFSDEDIVPAGFLGYEILDLGVVMLSAELGYYDLGDYKKNGNTVDASAISLAGVVYLPIGPFIELYAKAGIASVSGETNSNGTKDDFDGTEAFGGAGFAIDIFDTIDIYAEYLTFDTEVNSELVGVGVRLDF